MKDDTGTADAPPPAPLSPSSTSPHPPFVISSFFLGAICVPGFAPLAWFPLPIIALTGLILIWRAAPTPKLAAIYGYAFGLGLFLFGVSWVYVSLADFGGMPAPVAALATLLFCAILSLYPAAVGYAQRRLGGSDATRALLLIPALWTVGEWMRDAVTGFPWLATGYSQVAESPLSAFAPVVGVFGVSLVCALVSGLLAIIIAQIIDSGRVPFVPALANTGNRGWRFRGVASAIAIAALFASGIALRQVAWTEPEGPPLKVALLQGNIAQEMKFDEDKYAQTLDAYRKLALSSDAKLVVWPETAIPHLLDMVDPDYLEDLRKRAAANNADMLIGMPYSDEEGKYYNSVFSFGASPTRIYSKTHLVPFGEFIPWGFDWVLVMLHIPMGEFTRGTLHPQPFAVAGQRVAVDICYEDAFGEEIIRQLPEATLLVNVSNVAWFGHSIAPMQHLQISQMRALETGRPMVRATNTGMTAAIDEHGAVLQVLPQYTEGALVATVQPQSGVTPFVRWGNSLALLLAGVFLATGTVLARRARRQNGANAG